MKTNTSTLKVILLVILFPLLIASCSNNSKYENSDNIMVEPTGESKAFKTVSVPSQEKDDTSLQENIKIIRNANLRMKVDGIEEATHLARIYASQYAGYVSDERMENNTYSKENRFTIRVPQEHFEVLMDSISSLSDHIDTKNVSTIDVTEEYVDIQSRLKTKREVKERYESILRSRAKTVEEVLNAEEKIRVLQEEIEVAEGRLRYMTSNISYSTIQVDVYEIIDDIDTDGSEEPSFIDDVKDSLRFGLSIIEVFILLLLRIWPLVVVGTVFGVFLYRKKKSRKE